jgi:hypothetical protein
METAAVYWTGLASQYKCSYPGTLVQPPQGPTIVGTGNGTPEVPELPNAWGYSWATLSPGVINMER